MSDNRSGPGHRGGWESPWRRRDDGHLRDRVPRSPRRCRARMPSRPLVATQLIKVTRLIQAIENPDRVLDFATRATNNDRLGTVSLDCDLVACLETSAGKGVDWKSDLMLARDSRHAFTLA